MAPKLSRLSSNVDDVDIQPRVDSATSNPPDAGLISDLGICSKTDIQDFPEMWKLYNKSHTAVTGERFCGSDTYYDWHDGKPTLPQPEERQGNWLLGNFWDGASVPVLERSRSWTFSSLLMRWDSLNYFGYAVPQWQLSEDTDTYERMVVEVADAQEYVATLDLQLGRDIKVSTSG